jgi:hypothetical protein
MPFQKGKSGNPNGRPRLGNTIADIARQVLETKKRGDKITRGEKILAKAAELAEGGSKPHMEFLFDRAYGKALENMNLSGGLSLYEQGSSEAARIADENGRAALLAEIQKLSGKSKK